MTIKRVRNIAKKEIMLFGEENDQFKFLIK